MMFSVCGSRTESMGDKINAYNMYIQTLSLIKFLMKLNNTSRNNNQDVDIRWELRGQVHIGTLLTFLSQSQTSRSFTASSVSAQPEALQDEETRTEGLPEDDPGRPGEVRGRPAGPGAAGSDQSHAQSCRQRGIQLFQGEERNCYHRYHILHSQSSSIYSSIFGEFSARNL